MSARSAAGRPSISSIDKQEPPLVRRNILFQSLDSGIFMAGQVFFQPMTILVVLIQKLWNTPVLVGLVSGLFFLGAYLPGIFTTRLAERFPFRKPFIAASGFIQRLCLLGLVLSLFLLPAVGPQNTALLVLLCFGGFSVMGGVYTNAWIDFCAKTIPVRYRARTNAFRAAIAGAGGIAGIFLIDALLKGPAFPGNFQLVIFIGFALLFGSFFFFLMIREKTPSPPAPAQGLRAYAGSLGTVLRSDRNFRRFLWTQAVLSVSEWGPAFFTAYAVNRFGAGPAEAVLYTLLFNVSFLASGFLLGFIGDKTGNLNVLRIGAGLSLLSPLLIVLFPSPVTLYFVFLLAGINNHARLNGFQVIVSEFGDDASRIRYLTLAAVIGSAPFGLMPILGGVLLSAFKISYAALFAVGAAFALVALLLFLFWVKDPRQGVKQ